MAYPLRFCFLQRVGYSSLWICSNQQSQSRSSRAHRWHKTKNCSTAILSHASPAAPSQDSHACNAAFLPLRITPHFEGVEPPLPKSAVLLHRISELQGKLAPRNALLPSSHRSRYPLFQYLQHSRHVAFLRLASTLFGVRAGGTDDKIVKRIGWPITRGMRISFLHGANINSIVFNRFRTLCAKHPGGWRCFPRAPRFAEAVPTALTGHDNLLFPAARPTINTASHPARSRHA